MDLSEAHPSHTYDTATTASIVLRRLIYESINQIYLIHAQSRQYKALAIWQSIYTLQLALVLITKSKHLMSNLKIWLYLDNRWTNGLLYAGFGVKGNINVWPDPTLPQHAPSYINRCCQYTFLGALLRKPKIE